MSAEVMRLGGFLRRLFWRTCSMPGVERCRDRVPEVQERVLLRADIDEHGLEALFDVLDAPLEDAADDVLVADAFDVVFV